MHTVQVDSPSEYMLYVFYRLSEQWPTVVACDNEGQVYRRCPRRIPAYTETLLLYPSYDQYVVHQLLRQTTTHLQITDKIDHAEVSGSPDILRWLTELPALAHRTSGRMAAV